MCRRSYKPPKQNKTKKNICMPDHVVMSKTLRVMYFNNISTLPTGFPSFLPCSSTTLDNVSVFVGRQHVIKLSVSWRMVCVSNIENIHHCEISCPYKEWLTCSSANLTITHLGHGGQQYTLSQFAHIYRVHPPITKKVYDLHTESSLQNDFNFNVV